jgi:hypothetical protein
MKTNYNRVPTRFGPETGFEIKPIRIAPSRAHLETEFERLKNELLREHLEEAVDGQFHSPLRRAAHEAAALAWATPFPLLVLPVLFEEKAQEALDRFERQELVRQRTRELLAI